MQAFPPNPVPLRHSPAKLYGEYFSLFLPPGLSASVEEIPAAKEVSASRAFQGLKTRTSKGKLNRPAPANYAINTGDILGLVGLVRGTENISYRRARAFCEWNVR